jgi:SlyX protein
MSDRLTEIEIKIAHVEQAINELSDAMYQQQMLIERLENGFSQLKDRLVAADKSPAGNDPGNEKPPHY